MRATHLVITEPFEKLKQDKITFSWITLLRLQKLGSDALALYIHYCSTARLQSKVLGRYSNTIKATSTYSMNGLNMTSDRFSKAKKLLLENGFIEDYMPRDKKGQIKGHYIKMHYLLKNTVVDEDINEIHTMENPEGGLPSMWENQSEENLHTNTKDKNRNTIDKKVNASNEKVNKIIIASQEVSLLDKETLKEPAPTDNIMLGNHKPSLEEQEAQEIVDAIKTECAIDLKVPKKWQQQVKDITTLQAELPRTTKDFINCVRNLQENPFYKQIHLSLVLKTIRNMPTINKIQNEDDKKLGTTEQEFLTGLFEGNAKFYKTTPEYEKLRYDLECVEFLEKLKIEREEQRELTPTERAKYETDKKRIESEMAIMKKSMWHDNKQV